MIIRLRRVTEKCSHQYFTTATVVDKPQSINLTQWFRRPIGRVESKSTFLTSATRLRYDCDTCLHMGRHNGDYIYDVSQARLRHMWTRLKSETFYNLWWLFYLVAIVILVVNVMEEIQTVAEPEWRHPLVSVRSSLNGDTDDLCWTAEIHPYPLRMIINTRWPGCSVASSDPVSVKSGKEGRVVSVPWRRCSNSFVGDFSGLHSHWQMTHGSYKNEHCTIS